MNNPDPQGKAIRALHYEFARGCLILVALTGVGIVLVVACLVAW